MPTTQENDLISSLKNIFGSSKSSDVTVRCGSDVYQLHRAIICPRSGFFAAACDSGFKESMTAVITLNDDDQPTVQRMLTYIYTRDYDDGDDNLATTTIAAQNTDGLITDPMEDAKISHRKRMNNIRVYAIAEKYNIPELKELAKTKFQKNKKARTNTHLREVINAIFDSTPETDSGLRGIMVSRIARGGVLRAISKDGPLAPAIRDHSSLSMGLLREFVRKHSREQAKLKQLLGSLHQDAMQLYIPDRRDPEADFESPRRALKKFQRKLLKFKNPMLPS